jgi:nicotinate-nucleotide pyrophosphorylase (carboxylating)
MELIDWDVVDRSIAQALAEDLGDGDITTLSTVTAKAYGAGQIVARQACSVAGLFLVERLFSKCNPEINVEVLVAEGTRVSKGTLLCTFDGPYRALLEGERTLLNYLQRLCGIATLTGKFVRAMKGGKAAIYDTRKTTPGLRTLEKYAVRAVGARNHRMGLFDAILIKENHAAAAGGIDRAVARARKAHPEIKIEVEVRNMEELVLAVEYGADIVLLDNMEYKEIRKAVRLVGRRVELEVSGGINLRRARDLANSGVHRISVGALTHSAPAADLSMLIVKQRKRK